MRKEIIGNCELYLGDCREILPTLEGTDILLTDPPYAISIAGSKNASPNGTRNFDFFKGDADWASMNVTVKQSIGISLLLEPSTFLVWCSHRQIGFINEMLEEAGYSTRLLFWKKKCWAPTAPNAGFASAIETCVWGYKPGKTWNGGQYDPNIFECENYRNGQPHKVDHPTQKPLQLIKWQLKLLSSEGDKVIDPFMGSGTTGVACAQMGRKFVGVEIEEKYFDISCKRIEAAYRQPDMFVAQHLLPEKSKQEVML